MNQIKIIGFVVTAIMIVLLLNNPQFLYSQPTIDSSTSLNERQNNLFNRFFNSNNDKVTQNNSENSTTPELPDISEIDFNDPLLNNNSSDSNSNFLNFSIYTWPIISIIIITLLIIIFIILVSNRKNNNLIEQNDQKESKSETNSDLGKNIDDSNNDISDLHSKIHRLDEKINDMNNKDQYNSNIDETLKEMNIKLSALEQELSDYKNKNKDRNNKNQISLK